MALDCLAGCLPCGDSDGVPLPAEKPKAVGPPGGRDGMRGGVEAPGLKPGTWAIEGQAVGVIFADKSALSFFVMNVNSNASEECISWGSKLKPAGTDPASGMPKWRIKGHPDGGFFVKVDDGTISEQNKAMEQRCVWKLREDLKGKFFSALAAPPKSAKDFPTENFAKAVLYKDPFMNEPCSPTTQTIIEACCSTDEDMPTDLLERQKAIVKYYTLESPLYHEMNTALRDDDLSALRYYSAFIKELRDVFKTDHIDQIIEPFTGKVWRGITFPDPDAALQEYQPGQVFVWSAFTSMSVERDVAFNFGNVVFEVSCLPPKEAYDGAVAVYAPASVSSFSDFEGEAEILFPPNIQFKVKEVQMPGGEDESITSPLIICETVAFDTDEGLQEFQNFKKLLEEAQRNSEVDSTPAEERAGLISDGYKRLFGALDTNHSGTLSKKEARAALKKVQGAVSFANVAFPGLSLPGEGKDALKQYVQEMFDGADLDGNGTLTFDELLSFIMSKSGSEVFAQMSVMDWTSVKTTLNTLVEAFENADFSQILGA